MSRYDLKGNVPDGYMIPPIRVKRAVESRTLAQAWLLRGSEMAKGPFSTTTSRVAAQSLGKALANMRRAAAHLIPCSLYSGRPIDVTQDHHARRTWEAMCEDMGIPRAYCR